MKQCEDKTKYAQIEQIVGSMGAGDFLVCTKTDCVNYNPNGGVCKTNGYKKETTKQYTLAPKEKNQYQESQSINFIITDRFLKDRKAIAERSS